jgi:hypothetical protein
MRAAKFHLRGLSLFSLLAVVASSRAEGEWLRHFRIGGSVGMNISTDFKTSGTFTLNPDPPSSRGGITYDDGFVGVDSTGNENDATVFWGYNSASQVNGDQITFHQTKSFSASGTGKDDDFPPGFDMVYAGTFRQWEHVAIGGEVGFNLTVFGARDRRPLAATLTQRVDVYDASGIVIPDPGYRGPETPPGPLLSDTPNAQSDLTTAGTINGYRSLDGILYNFRLGPVVRWEFLPYWTLNASAGGALGIFDAEYEFNETINATATSSVHNRGTFGTTDLKFGGYAGAVVMYDTGDYWEAFLGAHFMSLQDGKVASGGREATMKLGATVFITAGINWTF